MHIIWKSDQTFSRKNWVNGIKLYLKIVLTVIISIHSLGKINWPWKKTWRCDANLLPKKMIFMEYIEINLIKVKNQSYLWAGDWYFIPNNLKISSYS